MGSGSTQVSPTQRRVLEIVKRRGEATADALAEELDTTPSAVRQHLTVLRSLGLVETRPLRGLAGRPADLYHCTALADPLFAREQDLAIEILDDLHDVDPALVEHVFDRRRQRMVEASRDGLDGTAIAERVAALTQQFDRQGYLADLDDAGDGRFRIHLHNCPISEVADRYEHACTAELGFIEDVLPDARVARVMHKHDHCSTCVYEISPATEPSPLEHRPTARRAPRAGPSRESA